jgi:hypothetical protein
MGSLARRSLRFMPRCRAKNRTELSISTDGTLTWLPGLACRVFSAEPSAQGTGQITEIFDVCDARTTAVTGGPHGS